MRPRKLRSIRSSLAVLIGIAVTAPAWAVSLSTTGTAQAQPGTNFNSAALAAAESTSAGSSTLVPVMAAEMQAHQIKTLDTAATPGGGAQPVGKPLNDVAFVAVATEGSRREITSAKNALPQLKSPQLKHLAEMLVNDHNNANARLSRIAEAKQWPVPGPSLPSAPPSGSASSDFDANWTAEMIDGHERSVALYRAQAAGSGDPDLRRYARDILPTIEQHLAELKSLQK
jgi:putative membrane protein